MLCRLVLLFLIWLFNALESRGLSSSKLQSSSPDTDITAPQLSNSPQYCTVSVNLYHNALVGCTYIWGRENSDQNSVVEKFVSILNNHVGSANKVKVVALKKLHYDLLPKAIAHAALI